MVRTVSKQHAWPSVEQLQLKVVWCHLRLLQLHLECKGHCNVMDNTSAHKWTRPE
jgi:hypothetical protein